MLNQRILQLLILVAVILPGAAFAQSKPTFFFNEINLSLNYTNEADKNTENRLGFGAAVYRSFPLNKPSFWVWGFEYDLSRRFKNLMGEENPSGYQFYTNVTYRIHSFSMPLVYRIAMDNKGRSFFALGFYIDYLYSIQRKAVSETAFDKASEMEKGDVGFILGAGMRIPLSEKLELVPILEYKHGLRDIAWYRGGLHNRYFRLAVGIRQR